MGVALLFCALGALGPLYWLAHNWWLYGDPLEFYRGPYSAWAIQGNRPYPGKGDWPTAWLYFRTAAQLCAGPGLALMAIAGAAASLARRVFWPLALLALPGVFYIWSIYSSATPIFVPTLWPHSYYNTRYGLAVLPLLAVASAGLVAIVPSRMRAITAALVIAAGTVHWMVASAAPKLDRLGGIARQFGGAPRLDSRGCRVPGAPLRARFRYHHIVRRFDRHLPPDGNPLARNIHRGQRPAMAGHGEAARTFLVAGVGRGDARRRRRGRCRSRRPIQFGKEHHGERRAGDRDLPAHGRHIG